MQQIFGYLCGRISTQQFVRSARLDARIPEWFQALILAGAEIRKLASIPQCHRKGACDSYRLQAPVSSFLFYAERHQRGPSEQNALSNRSDKAVHNSLYCLYSVPQAPRPILEVCCRLAWERGFV